MPNTVVDTPDHYHPLVFGLYTSESATAEMPTTNSHSFFVDMNRLQCSAMQSFALAAGFSRMFWAATPPYPAPHTLWIALVVASLLMLPAVRCLPMADAMQCATVHRLWSLPATALGRAHAPGMIWVTAVPLSTPPTLCCVLYSSRQSRDHPSSSNSSLPASLDCTYTPTYTLLHTTTTASHAAHLHSLLRLRPRLRRPRCAGC